MKVILLVLVLAASAKAQGSYDWTLINDPAYCPTCVRVSGAGVFTVSPTLFSDIRGSGYPILSLAGTLNGVALSLAPVPSSPPGLLGNLFYKPTLPVSWFAPLYLTGWTLTQSGDTHPGTGQLLTNGTITTPVAFTVTPAPSFSSSTRLPLLNGVAGPAPTRRTLTTQPRPLLNPLAIEISVPAAIALGIQIYEWHRHRRRYAYPAGRF